MVSCSFFAGECFPIVFLFFLLYVKKFVTYFDYIDAIIWRANNRGEKYAGHQRLYAKGPLYIAFLALYTDALCTNFTKNSTI